MARYSKEAEVVGLIVKHESVSEKMAVDVIEKAVAKRIHVVVHLREDGVCTPTVRRKPWYSFLDEWVFHETCARRLRCSIRP